MRRRPANLHAATICAAALSLACVFTGTARAQAVADLASGADVCGTSELLHYGLDSGEAWLYRHAPDGRPWLAGGTLLYRREAWRRVPFRPINVGEDTEFIHRQPAERVSGSYEDPRLQALLSGCAGHAMVPLEKWMTASFALMLIASGHKAGWPFVRGGTGRLEWKVGMEYVDLDFDDDEGGFDARDTMFNAGFRYRFTRLFALGLDVAGNGDDETSATVAFRWNFADRH